MHRPFLYCGGSTGGKGSCSLAKALGLGYEEASAHLAFPEALQVVKDGDDLLMTEDFGKGGHGAFEAWDCQFRPAFTDDAVE